VPGHAGWLVEAASCRFREQPEPKRQDAASTLSGNSVRANSLSGQFAWEGAVAIAQTKDDGCIASHRYPIFKNKTEIVEAGYLYSFFTTKDGVLLLNFHSRGAAGRNRPLNPRTLMKEKIPIPPLNLQPSTGFAGWEHIIRQRS